jgi:uncharacterized protein
MRVIDADTHIAPAPEKFTLENLLKHIEKSKMERVMVWLTPFYKGAEIEDYLEYVYNATKNHPGKLIGFGWADPTVGVAHAKDMVKRCIEEYGFYGVKLNGAQNHYIIDSDDLAMPVIEEIAKYGKPIAFHIGPDEYENTHPLRAARVAKLFPDIPIFMIHMGMDSEDMVASVIREAKTHPNMILIGSATKPENVLMAIHELGADRVCYGSDHPFRTMHVCKAMTEAVIDELPTAEQELVLGGNLLRTLGISG